MAVRTGSSTGAHGSPGADLLITSFAHSAPAVLAWLTPDVARRLVAQCGGDVPKARDKVRSIHGWREEMGLDLLCFPPLWPPAARTAHHHLNHHEHNGRHSAPPHAAGAGGELDSRAAQVRAAARAFGPTSRAIGLTLLHTDDARGLAVLWIEGACMCNTRKVLSQQLLLEQEDGQGKEQHRHVGRSASQAHSPDWLHRITLHVALMSTWLWGTRLPDQPIGAGRFVQVIDLQGVPTAMLMCGDGLAIIKAIMSAAHQFPQRLLATVVIHPPRGLAVAWAVVSKLLPPPVQQKIRFIRSHQPEVLRAELLSFIPEELLPVELGGKRRTCKGNTVTAQGVGDASPAAQLELESALAACVVAADDRTKRG